MKYASHSRNASWNTGSALGKLSPWAKAGFGVCDLGGNLFFTAMGFWTLNYLTDTAALSAALAGIAVMIGKFWDAIVDPFIGYLSDRTRTRFGRRRPFILFASVPMGLLAWYFFSNPHIENQIVLAIWATVALCALNTAYSLVSIPYSALTPELTKDYNERTSLNGYRFTFAIAGTILGAAIVLPIVGAFPTKSEGFSAAGFAIGAILAVTALVTFFSVREPKTHEAPQAGGFLRTYASVFKNRAYVVILCAFALNIVAINFLQGILVYYLKYVYRAESMTTFALVILLAIAMGVIPASVPLARRLGKRLTYQIGLAVLALSCLAVFFLGEALGLTFFLATMSVTGIGLGLTFVAPWSMLPDAVEWDAVTTGNRKEGSYYGMWTFVTQCGQALSIGIMGYSLGLAGYVPDVAQTAQSLACIKLFIGPIPAIVFASGVALLSRYPITEKAYGELLGKNEGTRKTG
jgi:glycoside/pentoside/hexuronide:cation symporter, GPH family